MIHVQIPKDRTPLNDGEVAVGPTEPTLLPSSIEQREGERLTDSRGVDGMSAHRALIVIESIDGTVIEVEFEAYDVHDLIGVGFALRVNDVAGDDDALGSGAARLSGRIIRARRFMGGQEYLQALRDEARRSAEAVRDLGELPLDSE